MYQEFPKISCLMVTSGRVELVKKSIQCYLNQVYKKKELIVLTQGNKQQNADIGEFISSLNRSDIQFVEAPQDLTLGAMRNLSIELSTGSIVCQWDDDDLYHPRRISTQYRALLGEGENVVASAYCQHLKYFSDTGQLYWIDWSYEPGWRKFLCGSIMFRKSLFHQHGNILYPESGDQIGREEDMNVLVKISKSGRVASASNACHYIYVFHGGNVYDLAHHKLVLNKRVFGRPKLLENQQELIETFRAVGLDRVKVCSLDEVVFEFSDVEAPVEETVEVPTEPAEAVEVDLKKGNEDVV